MKLYLIVNEPSKLFSRTSLDEFSLQNSLENLSLRTSLDEFSSRTSLDNISLQNSLDNLSSRTSLDNLSSRTSLYLRSLLIVIPEYEPKIKGLLNGEWEVKRGIEVWFWEKEKCFETSYDGNYGLCWKGENEPSCETWSERYRGAGESWVTLLVGVQGYPKPETNLCRAGKMCRDKRGVSQKELRWGISRILRVLFIVGGDEER